jgi:hypothetical protein
MIVKPYDGTLIIQGEAGFTYMEIVKYFSIHLWEGMNKHSRIPYKQTQSYHLPTNTAVSPTNKHSRNPYQQTQPYPLPTLNRQPEKKY